MTASGIIYLVGAGPGDPGLLTVRARELLDSCDAIVHDALANPALLSRAAGETRGSPELYDVGKRGGGAAPEGSARQDDINALLVRLGREGKRVVRLKGGDPFVFGRGSEEALVLHDEGIPFEIVPGVTAGIAAPAYAGIPVTHRGLATSVTFVTGHEDPAKPETTIDWSALARAGGTIVLYMGVRTLPSIVEALTRAGMPESTPAAAIEWGTYMRQRTVTATLGTLADRIGEAGIGAPAITVIGPVVELREHIAWFDRRPLFGMRIVVTRASAQAAALTARLLALGAEVMEMPATRIELTEPGRLRAAIDGVGAYSWVMFTSQNAVSIFWDALRESGRDARALGGAKVCVVGPATADALRERGLEPDVLPERFVAEGVLEALASHDLRGAHVLYTSAEGARDVLPAGLRKAGAQVEVIPIYRTVPDGEGAERMAAALQRGVVDLVTFTSASAVRAYVDAVGAAAAARAPAASIGPITSEAARAAGLEVIVEATESTIPGLVDAIASQVLPRQVQSAAAEA